MKTYFISSDIHSFFDEWMKALNDNGFNAKNPDHILVVLGDIFDRGPKPLEVLNFIKSLPKERRILIRGNHESLLAELYARGYAASHDRHNGTDETAVIISGEPDILEFETSLFDKYPRPKEMFTSEGNSLTDEYLAFRDKIDKERALRDERVYRSPKIKEIVEWIYSGDWVNYFETDKYIFVHSWIPLHQHVDFNKSMLTGYVVKTVPDTYREDWRRATIPEWDDAMWGCPWKKAKAGLNKTGKTIVCGHWHTSDFFNNLTKQHKDINDCPIFKSKRYKLIGLDACTAISGVVNCLVLKEDEL